MHGQRDLPLNMFRIMIKRHKDTASVDNTSMSALCVSMLKVYKKQSLCSQGGDDQPVPGGNQNPFQSAPALPVADWD